MSTQGADTTSERATRPVFIAKLQSRQEVAEGTMAFCFGKPAGWTFVAGQFIDLSLISPSDTDAEGNTRGFSIASAPFESTIMIATRLRDSAFKRVLQTLPLGTEVKIEGLFGDLRLHRDAAQPAVVLLGGIGITPFRSILLQAAHEKRSQRIIISMGIAGRHFTAIGAFGHVILGYFDLAIKEFNKIPIDEQVEVLSPVGDIALKDGEPIVLAHVVLGKRDGTAWGGRRIEAHVRPMLDGTLVESPAHLHRRYDPETELASIRL